MAEINRLLPFYQDLDFETADLILQLQLEDVEHVRDRAKGKQREGTEPDDSQQALAMMESDLQSMRSLIADRHMSQSIAAAVLADRPAIEESIREEEIAHRDRIMAQRLNGSDFTDTTQDQPESGEIKDSLLSKLAGMYMCEDDETLSVIAGLSNEVSDIEDGTSRAESSTQASSRRSESREIKCEACHDRKKHFEVMTNACGHAYCKTCLQELFELSTRDESLFPPRCCKQPMDIDDVQIFLTKELKDQFQKAKVEFGTKNRTYCSRGACSAFIPSASIEGDLATCQVCLTMTCAICKEGAHGGDCPEDTTLQEVLAAATENGWQRCYSCRRIIEIDYGCNHMTCPCGAEFCYVCGERWKTCRCPQWDENRLLERANVLVDRDVPNMNAADPHRENRVEDAAEMLRERHNCNHTRWRYIRGSHRCEECHDRLPNYIFECRQCRIQACNRCRLNRL